MQKNSKIFVIRLSAMGDVAMISPIVSSLSSQYPDKEIYVLTRAFFQPFFEKNSNIHFVDIDLKHRHKGLIGIVKLFFDIRKKYGKIGYVADLHSVIRSFLLSFLMRLFMFSKVVHLDKARTQRGDLISKRLNQVPRVYKQYLKVFEQLGFPVMLASDFKFAKREMPQLFIEDKKTKIGIAPFAQHRGKAYPVENMQRVIDTLSQNENLSLYIFGGGSEEQEQAKILSQNHSNVHNAIGVLSLEQELALISNMRCMVTMDSSSMHMASLFGVEAITIWGATAVECGFLGINQSEDNVLRSNIDCSPCSIFGKKVCRYGDYRCFDDITPEMIILKVLKIIE